MKVIGDKQLEECIDGVMIKDITLDVKITVDFINYLGRLGTLEYFPDFLKPFFRIRSNEIQIKGILDEDNFNVIFKTYTSEKEQNFYAYIAEYR